MIRKPTVLLLLLALCLGLTACGQPEAATPELAAVPASTAPAAETAAPAVEPTTEPATEPTTVPTEPPKPWLDNVLMSAPNPYPDPLYLFGSRGYKRQQVSTVNFLDTLADMPEDAWDVSEAQNGSVMAWMVLDAGKYHLYIAGEGGVSAPADSSYLFGNYEKATEINFNGNFHTETAQDMNWMFAYSPKLEQLDLSSFDTSNVTDMCNMFESSNHLVRLNLSGWDTSNVTNMSRMFNQCFALEALDVSHFDTSKVTDINSMFSGCRSLTTLDVSNFDTSKVVFMNDLFAWDKLLVVTGVENWDTSNVTTMRSLFADNMALTHLDLSGWDTSKVTDMKGMLCYIPNLEVNLGEWEVTSVTDYKDFMKADATYNGEPWQNLFKK